MSEDMIDLPGDSIPIVLPTQIGVEFRHEKCRLPMKATRGSAAFDIATPIAFSISPNEYKMIDTGMIFEIPPGWTGLLFARSGLAVNNKISLATGVSVIDNDFRETLKVPLVMNHSGVVRSFWPGDRIAQMIFLKIDDVGLYNAELVEKTVRGGFGSTGA